MELSGLKYFAFFILYLLCDVGKLSQQAVCNNPAALGMESGAIERAQITVPGFEANHEDLDKLRFDIGEARGYSCESTPCWNAGCCFGTGENASCACTFGWTGQFCTVPDLNERTDGLIPAIQL